jgi:hypothetical protein
MSARLLRRVEDQEPVAGVRHGGGEVVEDLEADGVGVLDVVQFEDDCRVAEPA